MEKIRIFHDRTANTLTVWFSDPSQEHIAEETGEEVVLMKDKQGRVIGFEKLNFSSSPKETLDVGFESVSVS